MTALVALVAAAPAVVPASALATGAAPAFDAARTLAIGAGVTDPQSLVAGDLDGDGRTDLVAGSANGGSGVVSVLRATAAGTFAAPLGSPFGLGTAGGTGAVALGDLNGDGRADVLAAVGSGTVANDQLVPLAGDGTGDLQAGTPVTAHEQLAGLALADLDGDGDLDALAASTTAVEADQLSILEQGPGGLTPVGAAGAPGTLLATGVAAGDLDGDGLPDALVVSRNAGTGSAWAAAGSGLALTAAAPVPVGADPVAVALADVDGDGDRDGLVLDGSAALLTVLRNDGAGGLTPTGVAVPGLAAGSGLATGDLNGDGAADVVVTDAAGGQAGVLLGDGAGGFGAPQWLATGAGPRSPVVADLTGDGLPDIATADATAGALTLLRNASAPAPTGTLAGAFADELVGRTGPAHTVTIANGGAAPLVVTGVSTAGAAADDFLVTNDTCTGQPVASGGATCTVRVRFAPSAAGTRTAVLRLRHGSGATYDVALTAAGLDDAADDAGATPAGTTTATTGATTSTTPPTTAATPTSAARPAAEPVIAPVVGPKVRSRPPRLILTLSVRKIEVASGRRVAVGFALGRAAKVVLRVKRAGRTVEIVRANGREGRNRLTWDGRLGSKPAPAGRYRVDVYAVAADGRAARGSITLTVG